MSLAKLALPAQIRRRYDPDAAAYIANVEAADGQSLEQLVKEAITGFVIDCKTTGIWSAIQSCCLLCGARTLNGALVPLKGSAPTNFNSLFNNNDYSRDIGLKGNGSSKYLNTNFLATSLDQNNFHFSMYISTLSSAGTQKTYMADGGRNMYRPITNNTSTQFNINASFGASGGDLNMASSIGFCGLSRDNASNFTINVGSRNRTYVANSIIDSGTLGGTMRIFGRNGNGVMGEFSDGRISFYSIGNSIDLKNLNMCVNRFINLLDRHFDSSYQMTDSDAIAYVNQLTIINNVKSMGYTYRKAIDDFVIGCKNDNIWNSIKTCCILCGSPRLSGALYPLVGVAPTNYGFADRNYIPSIGLSNSSRANYLIANRLSSDDPQDSHHLAIFVAVPESTTAECQIIGVGANDTGATHISTNANRRHRNGTSIGTTSIIQANTFTGINRSNSTNFTSRTNGVNTVFGATSQASQTINNGVFARGAAGNLGFGITNATLSFYSIGSAVDLALLDNRVSTLVNQLSSTRTI